MAARKLIRDRDGRLAPACHPAFRSQGIEIVRTPYRAPTANAVTERWVDSAQRACLDHPLTVSEAPLLRALTAYVARYNRVRPHRGLEQRTLLPPTERAEPGPIRRQDLLGGVLRGYDREAAQRATWGQKAFRRSAPTGRGRV